MKKFFIPVAVVAVLAFSSCGGPSICDCMKLGEEASKEIAEAGGDEAKIKAVEKKFESKIKACEKLGEGKSPEEQAKMMEEALKCK